VPTANNSPAKKEETPGVKRAECQMVLVYAHFHRALTYVIRGGKSDEARHVLERTDLEQLKLLIEKGQGILFELD
jgi:hypothetical protein